LAVEPYTVSPHSVSIAFPLLFPCVHRKSKVGERIEPFFVGVTAACPASYCTHFNHCSF